MTADARCGEVRLLAAELALGLVTGPERAAALAHLETCPACRAEVESLAGIVDQLLLATPRVEPPPGFESGVLDRLAAESGVAAPAPSVAAIADGPDAEPDLADFAPFPRRRGSVVRRVLALAAVVVLVVVGVALGRVGHHGASGQTVEVLQMRTPAGQRVGRVDLGRDPGSVFVALPGWQRNGDGDDGWYFLRVAFDDGHTTSLGPISLTPTKLTWGTLTTFDPKTVRSVAMVDQRGNVYCSTALI